jgi:hypothetical protein
MAYPDINNFTSNEYLSLLDDGHVTRQERITGVLDERKYLILILVVQIIKENSSNSTSLFSVL